MLIKKFPLLYISILYLFSRKDKIIFFLQQFTIISISLIIATIFCCFSIINGFYDQFSSPLISHYGNIFATNKYENLENDAQQIFEFNKGFEKLQIVDENIRNIEYVRMQKTLIVVEENKIVADVIEIPTQQDNIILSSEFKKYKNLDGVTVFDPNSTSIIGPFSRFKKYENFSISKNKGFGFVIYMSSSEYQKMFHNPNYTFIRIFTHSDNNLSNTINKLNKTHDLKFSSWTSVDTINSQLIKLLDLQKKIFYMIYTLLFLLLGIIIILTNIIFFKEKRKDWALYKMLNLFSYSVERIFMYKTLISYLLSLFIGLSLGALLSIYSNEITNFIAIITGLSIQNSLFFGLEKLTYVFLLKDIMTIAIASFILFFINFTALLFIFRKEKGASFLKSS